MRTLKLTWILLLSVVIISGKNTQAQSDKNVEQLFENYFQLKDALVASDYKKSQTEALSIINTTTKVEMKEMTTEQHSVWMKHVANINELSKSIAKAKELESQRKIFIKLSESFYALSKVLKPSTTFYQQRCPMANSGKGATWLSKDAAIRNPYYGSKMLTCGKTIETIK